MKVERINDPLSEGYTFKCPGCKIPHYIPVRYAEGETHQNGRQKPTYRFNGSVDKPSFKPDIRVTGYGARASYLCHFFICAGEIVFLGDSTHELSGRRMFLEEIQP